jgi:hypothetical protein
METNYTTTNCSKTFGLKASRVTFHKKNLKLKLILIQIPERISNCNLVVG